ncbi:hypothetical protein B0H17DRAFT_1216257 [Mycena rosella]|uniref:Uncharacterized protein n=1 Tax=Mycena rosella TaxID=1033263 RepID=A0AAD7FWG8_MYCRO|nr:hypothetical protein B0H17DRAFT_1216257 [Mycena rosella]
MRSQTLRGTQLSGTSTSSASPLSSQPSAAGQPAAQSSAQPAAQTAAQPAAPHTAQPTAQHAAPPTTRHAAQPAVPAARFGDSAKVYNLVSREVQEDNVVCGYEESLVSKRNGWPYCTYNDWGKKIGGNVQNCPGNVRTAAYLSTNYSGWY